MRRCDASEFPAASRADEGADGHVGVGRAALMAVEALPVKRPRHDFAQRLEILLVLLPLRRRHCLGTRGSASRFPRCCRRRRRRRLLLLILL